MVAQDQCRCMAHMLVLVGKRRRDERLHGLAGQRVGAVLGLEDHDVEGLECRATHRRIDISLGQVDGHRNTLAVARLPHGAQRGLDGVALDLRMDVATLAAVQQFANRRHLPHQALGQVHLAQHAHRLVTRAVALIGDPGAQRAEDRKLGLLDVGRLEVVLPREHIQHGVADLGLGSL